MQITKEYLTQQIESLKKQAEQVIADYNAIMGAIQANEQSIAYLEIPEKTVDGES